VIRQNEKIRINAARFREESGSAESFGNRKRVPWLLRRRNVGEKKKKSYCRTNERLDPAGVTTPATAHVQQPGKNPIKPMLSALKQIR
jgi:hypothetical protein